MMQNSQNDNGCANLEFANKYISKILCKKLYFVQEMTLHITFWPTNFVQIFFWIDEISYVFYCFKNSK